MCMYVSKLICHYHKISILKYLPFWAPHYNNYNSVFFFFWIKYTHTITHLAKNLRGSNWGSHSPLPTSAYARGSPTVRACMVLNHCYNHLKRGIVWLFLSQICNDFDSSTSINVFLHIIVHIKNHYSSIFVKNLCNYYEVRYFVMISILQHPWNVLLHIIVYITNHYYSIFVQNLCNSYKVI